MANENDKSQEAIDSINQYASSAPIPEASSIHCLTIVGHIEGHQAASDGSKTTKYEHLMPLIAAMEESSEVKGLLVLLNTAGGDVDAGLGIAELITGMRKPTASIVLGGGHSIGVPLAVSAKKSFIAPSASMAIHPVRMNGLVIGVQQSFNYFQKTQDRVVNFVLSHSDIKREEFMELMMRTSELAHDVGSVINAEEAVDCGLIDQIGTLSDALGYLHNEIGKAENKSGGE